MKEQPRTLGTHFQNSNLKHTMKRLQTPQELIYDKFYVHEKILRRNAAVNLSKTYFLKNAKKTCKPNNHNLNQDWIKPIQFDESKLCKPKSNFSTSQIKNILSKVSSMFLFAPLQFTIAEELRRF